MSLCCPITENLKGHDHLAQVRCSLEAAQDEVEMMKVSLSAKEEQLVQCQDKLLSVTHLCKLSLTVECYFSLL